MSTVNFKVRCSGDSLLLAKQKPPFHPSIIVNKLQTPSLTAQSLCTRFPIYPLKQTNKHTNFVHLPNPSFFHPTLSTHLCPLNPQKSKHQLQFKPKTLSKLAIIRSARIPTVTAAKPSPTPYLEGAQITQPSLEKTATATATATATMRRNLRSSTHKKPSLTKIHYLSHPTIHHLPSSGLAISRAASDSLVSFRNCILKSPLPRPHRLPLWFNLVMVPVSVGEFPH